MAQMLMTSWRHGFDNVEDEPTHGGNPGDALSQLLNALAPNTPAIDEKAHERMSAAIAGVAKRFPDRHQEADKVKAVVQELEQYHNATEQALEEQLDSWRGLAKKLLCELSEFVPDADAVGFQSLGQKVGMLSTGAEITGFADLLHTFLHPAGSGSRELADYAFQSPDLSAANDNATGLRGGGAAVEHLQSVLDRAQVGFVAVFQLSCLNVIGERFGDAAVEDCLMAVSAFLTERLERDDAIYHWNDTTLLAIFEGRNNKGVLAKELERIASQNRDITITIAGRTVLIRIPMTFDLSPVSGFRSGNDLYKLASTPGVTM
jgi:GGDEF domain-containing protein